MEILALRYDESIIEQVREANDIVSVVGQYVKLEKKGANYFGLCPFHNEKTGSFSVNPKLQIYYCFGCSKGGNVISFIMEYENASFPEALKILADRAHIALPAADTYEDPAEKKKRERMLAIYKDAAYFYHDSLYTPDGSQGLRYLMEKRRLSKATITHFGLGYSGKFSDGIYQYLKHVKGYSDNDLKESGLISFSEKGPKCMFWNRVMFPIMDLNNRVIGFGGRVMGDGEPKYLNSHESLIFNKSNVLYGLNFAKKSREKFLLLCEGYMDVISLHQAGFTNAVASLGTAFTDSHARLLKRYTDTVILTQDSDAAGVRARMRSFPILHGAGLKVKVLDMGPYKDPDEFIKANGPDAYRECIDKARNAFLYNMDMLKQEYDLTDPAKVTDLYRRIARELTVFTDKIERDNYVKAVSREQNIDYDSLHELTEREILNSQGMSRTVMPMQPAAPAPKESESERRKTSGRAGRSEDILLYWMSERKEVIPGICAYLKPEDFSTPLKRKIAQQLMTSSDFCAAAFLDREDLNEEEQSEAGRIFAGTPVTTDDDDLYKILTEAVRNILKEIYDGILHERNVSAEKFQETLLKKSGLQNIRITQ